MDKWHLLESIPEQDGVYLARMDDLDDEPERVEVKGGEAFLNGRKRLFANYEWKKEAAQLDGLYSKYRIERTDNQPLAPGFEAFVLRLDDGGDPAHVAACHAAVLKYADEIEPHLPQLAQDLRARYS